MRHEDSNVLRELRDGGTVRFYVRVARDSILLPAVGAALAAIFFAAAASRASSARAPARIPFIEWLPSWQA